MKKQILCAVVSVSLLAACAEGTGSSGQQGGAVIGALAGGVLGSTFGEGSGKTAATIGGALLGMWAGSHIGASLTRQDQVYHNTATQQAYQAPLGESISWNNPESGHSGTVTPTREGRTNTGRYCREFQQSITVDGKTERAYGTACQQPDGSWQIVNN